jgi:ribonuclease HI
MSSTSSIKVIQINLRHSAAATAALSHLILEKRYDVALIQEPYIFTDLHIPYVPEGFLPFHSLNEDHAFGAMIWAKQGLGASTFSELSHNFLTGIQLPIGGLIHYLFSYYAKPSNKDVEVALASLVRSLGSRREHSVFGADANAKNTLWGSQDTNEKGRNLETLCNLNDLNIANSGIDADADAFVPAGTSFIDVTLFGDKVTLSDWQYLNVPSGSDHPYISFTIRADRRAPESSRQPKLPSGSLLDRAALSAALGQSSAAFLRSAQSISSQQDLDAAVLHMSTFVQDEAKKCRIRRSRKATTTPRSPWWNEDLSEARREARAAFRRWSKLKRAASLPQDVVKRCRENFKRLSAKFQRMVRHFTNKFWREQHCNSLNRDLLATLRTFAKKDPSPGPPSAIYVDGKLLTEPEDVARAFLQAFFKKEAPSTQAHARSKELADKILSASTGPVPSVTRYELATALSMLKKGSAPGVDLLPSDIVQVSADVFQDALCNLFTAVFEKACFPNSWKVARITIIPKQNKPSYCSPDSFRPVSILPIFSKLLERVILNRLKWFATEEQWFSQFQHGFREGRSTESAAHQLIERIENGFSRKAFTACVFLDIKAAFDSAWHSAIILALSRRGCPSYLCKTIASFLTGRKGVISIGSASTTFDIETGCPQGSVLSAFLWNTLIEEVFHLCLPEGVFLPAYADDLTVGCSDPEFEVAIAKVQRACDRISEWCRSVKLELNASKTVVVLFDHRKRRSGPIPVSVTVNGETIAGVSKTTFLGMTLDDRLNWSEHVSAKCNAAARIFQTARRYLSLTWGLNRMRLQSIYRAIVEPILLYNCSVWASALKSPKVKKMLRSTQRKMALLITKSFRTASTESLLLLAGLLPIDYRVREIASLRLLEHSNQPFCPSSKSMIHKWLQLHHLPNVIEKTLSHHLPEHPPWLIDSTVSVNAVPKNPPLNLTPTDSSTVRAYTDGSVLGRNQAGFALVIADCSGEIHTAQRHLPPDSSIFQAEGLAMSSALTFLTSADRYSTHELYSDSASVLSAATSTGRCSSIVMKIREALAKHPNTKLFWIPSHSGHHGNERADELAKLAASSLLNPSGEAILPSRATVKRKIRAVLLGEWNEEWQHCKSGRTTWSFFPSVASARILNKMSLPYQVLQLFTGHCRLNSYLHRFKCSPTPFCAQCRENEEETADHFLFKCKTFESERRALKSIVCRTGISWPPRLAALTESQRLLRGLLKFITQTKRLDVG